ncbi:hypothetical protein [Dyadobacter fermentans]|uniref:DZANK-type domain-containing protein n=1 Tax=Dyadobacter fermentans (strain ATCC 700827 / DSM 18053 / CIP 107007 / KCTC 52180 / NS114) TaxID=471854 RepID=C6VTJ1_DYAFD|nr:hypothetical protein [Dyadobacter fermentans]ACT92934.1 hypothetical protein Dfer_1693 [Dyadobacter fermentans DSM 18053]
MQVCNNCGTINETDARICTHCRIQGSFSTVADAPHDDASEAKQQCRNCGSLISAHLPKCPECRFPVPIRRAENRQQPDGTFVIGSLRAG